MKAQQQIKPYLQRFTLEAGIRAILAGACLTAGLFCAAVIVSHLLCNASPGKAFLWAVPVFLLGSLIFFFLYRPSGMDAARRMDRELKLETRTATALFFSENDSLFARLQRQDALEQLAAVSNERIPLRISWKPLIVTACLFLAAAGLSFLPYNLLHRNGQAAVNDPVTEAGDASFDDAIGHLEQKRAEQARMEQENAAAMETFLSKISQLMEEHEVSTTKTTAEQVKSVSQLQMNISGAMNAYAQFLAALLLQEHWEDIGVALLTGDAYVIREAFDTMCSKLISLTMPEEAQEVSLCSEELKTAFSLMDKEAQEMKISITLHDSIYRLEWIGGRFVNDKDSCDQELGELFETLGDAFFDYYATSEESLLKKQSIPQDSEGDIHVEVRSLNHVSGMKQGGGSLSYGSGAAGTREEKTMGNPEYSEKVLTFDPYLSDPERGDYVPYGKVYGRYYKEMSEDMANGRIPEDIQEAIDEYFGKL